jgi:LmbE family N-acetylglucosaminyl deacetylase
MTKPLLEEVPSSALAIYAHPDDPAISCGGTLARWADGGCRVDVVVCAAGDKGSADPQTDPEALALVRVGEAERSGTLLGARRVHFLDHLDGELDNDSVLRGELVAIIRELTPEAIVCPDPLAVFFGEHHYNHRDHRIVGWAALDAAAPAAASPLYFRGVGTVHQVRAAYLSGSLEPSAWVDVSKTIERKIAAVACHASQLADGGDWIAGALREGAQIAGREAGVACAEPFRRVRLAP